MGGLASRTADVQDARCPSRSGHVATCVGENLIVWGGFQTSGNTHDLAAGDVWFYNADTDFWTCRKFASEHPMSTNGASSVLVKPYWYMIGGWMQKGYTKHVYRLHVTTLKWERVKTSSPGLSPRWNFTSWEHKDKIYCFGGYGPDVKDTGLHQYGEFVVSRTTPSMKEGWNNQLLALDVDTHEWSNPLCKGIAPSPRSGHAAAVLEDKVYICGGVCSGAVMLDLHCLNLTTMTWSGELTPTGPVPERRCWHSLTAVGLWDRLLLFGGLSADEKPLDDLWMLSTTTMEWTLVKRNTGHPRHYHTTCCTQSGNVLIFGGCVDNIISSENLPRFTEQILEFQIKAKPVEGHPSQCKTVLDMRGELGPAPLDYVDAPSGSHLPRLGSFHDISLPDIWPDLSRHNPKLVDVVRVADHDTAMRQHFHKASTGSHDTVYRMQQKTRGLFLLINNESFEQARWDKGWSLNSDREGTEVDATALTELFTQLGFKVHRKDNRTAENMRQELRAMLSRDHKKYDCFACAILSHGERGAIFGTDGEPFSVYGTDSSSSSSRHKPDSLMDIVTTSRCTSLAGKPKLFFIQACQGGKGDPGVCQADTAVETVTNVTDEQKDSGETPPTENRMAVTEETLARLLVPVGAALIAKVTTAGNGDPGVNQADTAVKTVTYVTYEQKVSGDTPPTECRLDMTEETLATLATLLVPVGGDLIAEATTAGKGDPGVNQADTAVKTITYLAYEQKKGLLCESSFRRGGSHLFPLPGFVSFQIRQYGTWLMQAVLYVFSRFARMLHIRDRVTADSGVTPPTGEKMDVTEETGPDSTCLIAAQVMADGGRVVPVGADIFIAEATTPGFMSFRNTVHGTWFIQALVYVFSRFAHTLDIGDLMTAVQMLVSKAETEAGGYKEQPGHRAALNKKFYFFPGLYKPRS